MENQKVKDYNYCLAPFCLPCYYAWRRWVCAVQRELHCTLHLKNAQTKHLCFTEGMSLRACFSFSTKASLVIAGNLVRNWEWINWMVGMEKVLFLVFLSSTAISGTCTGPLGPTPTTTPFVHPLSLPTEEEDWELKQLTVSLSLSLSLIPLPFNEREKDRRGVSDWEGGGGVYKGLAHHHFLHAACFVLWFLVNLAFPRAGVLKTKTLAVWKRNVSIWTPFRLWKYQKAPAGIREGRKCENERGRGVAGEKHLSTFPLVRLLVRQKPSVGPLQLSHYPHLPVHPPLPPIWKCRLGKITRKLKFWEIGIYYKSHYIYIYISG